MPLTVSGIDFAWGIPPYVEAQRSGFKFVMRYISHDAAKDLTQRELAEWKRRGIAVGVVFESTADRAAQGYSAGQQDARFAHDRCAALGVPDLPVYFAVDFDPTLAQIVAVTRYLIGAASVLGHSRVGVYGGYAIVDAAWRNRSCSWFWQTYAWSGGKVHPAAHIYQYRNGVRVGGVSCDLNHARDDVSAGLTYSFAPKPLSQEQRKKRSWRQHLGRLRAVARPHNWTRARRVVGRKLKALIAR